jgi:NADH dehydrogenase
MDPPEAPSTSPAVAPGRGVLVLGGSGFLGRSLCRLMSSSPAGSSGITVATRRRESAAHLRHLPRLTVQEVDVFDPARLAELVRGHHAVVNLVAILHGDAARFQRVHVDLVRSIATACRAAGTPRVIHLSALGVRRDAPSLYLRSKAEGEACLASAGISATVLRPSVMFGAHDRFLNVFADVLRLVPFFPLACAHARFQPVWVEDVAAAIVRCLHAPESRGRVHECAGPKVYELMELVRLAGKWSGHPRWVLPLPARLGRWQAWVLERLPGEMMSRDNLDSMRVPNVATGLPSLIDLGIVASALEDVAPRYLAGEGD